MIVAAVPPFQAEIVPFRLAKMNRAGCPLASTKSVVPLNTCPVGPCGPAGVVGMVTVSGTLVAVVPSALLEYRVLTPVRWSDTQNGLVELNDMPHGFFKSGSTTTG